MTDSGLAEASTEMAARRIFSILGSSGADGISARLGELKLRGRKPIQTPNFTGVTSRGTIPHLTPDVLTKYTSISSAYMALEDCMYYEELSMLGT
jgi:queuine tRNA-ribosyltransferase accessory subunit